jgi:Type II CAAX prenyl endopeptidase Rce1-like
MSSQERTSRRRGLVTVLLSGVTFVALITAFNALAKYLFAARIASGWRVRVTVELTAAMIAEAAVLLLTYMLLLRRGTSFRSVGLWRPAPWPGWSAAGLTAALFIAFNLALPLRGHAGLGEISWFRLYNAIIAGSVAGLMEETFFRGFTMDELRRSGFGNAAQVVLSSVVYGGAHAAWGLTSGVFTFELVGSAVIGTTVFGLFCSAVYLLSGRSLMPVIFGHAVIDSVIEPWLFMVAVTMCH